MKEQYTILTAGTVEDGTNPPFLIPAVTSSTVFNEDCMLTMKRYPDKFFNLAIVDPPYGLDKKLSSGGGKMRNTPFKKLYRDGEQWDVLPDEKYFEELRRVSEHQIIWGGNYFSLPPTRGIICWDKKQALPTFSRWEYGWTSFDKVAKMFEGVSTDNDRFHPTQKPIKLYEWILAHYAEAGWKIIDTHLGSGSSRIACHKAKIEFVGSEINTEYFERQEARFKNFTAQTTLW